VDIVADNVQFLGSRGDSEGGTYVPAGAAAQSSDDFPPSAADDDIPF
jgi:single-stranded DNA-binding protein